jgi:pSer/pThr/pTyr-binding forkhead associated (FHA) protein/thioredoxin-like negative regulator of GroEL
MGILDTIFGNKKKKIEAALQKDPTVDKVLELSAIYVGENDLSSALRLLRAWSKKFNDEKMRNTLHEVELLERKSEISALEIRIKEAPNSLNYSRLASLKIKSGELEDALDICKESLEKFPQFNSGAHQCMGDIFLIQENYDGAAKEYELVIKEDPNNFQVVKSLCEIYIYKNLVSKAVSYLEDLIKKNPADQTLRDMLTRAKAGEKLVEEAEEEELIPTPTPIPVAVQPTPIVTTANRTSSTAPVNREPETSKIKDKQPILRVTAPDGTINEILLQKDEFVVGRHQEADLSIDDGKNFISRKHTAFRKVNGKYQVVDMGSGNGTFVNGSKIQGPHNLRNKDIVKVGYYSIQFMGGDSGPVIPAFDATMLEDSEATIVGQEFSYLGKSAEPVTAKISVDSGVEKVVKIAGVLQVIVINSSGFPLHFAANDKSLDEQKASALMSHIFGMVQVDTDKLDIKQVHSCDIITDKLSVYLYSKNGYVVCVIGSLSCKKAQVDVEIKSLLQGLV